MKKIFLIAFLFVSVYAFPQSKGNQPKFFNVENFGARGDALDFTTAGMTNGGTTVTIGSGPFTTRDVGKACIMYGSGAAGINQRGTITAFISATQVTVSFTAGGTVSSKEFFYGTEATTGIQAAINAADGALGGIVWIPNGVYYLGGSLVTSQNGTNPNSQLYIPWHTFSGQFEYTIDIEGESAVNLASGYYGASNPRPTTGVVLRSVISGTGFNPSILGGGDSTSGNQVATSVWLKRINFQSYTNTGTVAPTLSGVNFLYMYKASMERICVSLDVPNQSSANPTATETFGIGVSFRGNAGPCDLIECSAMGFRYGMILGEHLRLINCYIFSCVFGYVIQRGYYAVSGEALYHACLNGVYFPNSTVMGIPAGTAKVMDLHMEAEVDTGAAGAFWYNASWVSNISDSGNNAFGIIRTICDFVTGTVLPVRVVGGSNLNSLDYDKSFTISQVLSAGSTATSGQTLTIPNSGVGAQSLNITGYNSFVPQLSIGQGIELQSQASDNQYIGSNVYESTIAGPVFSYVTSTTAGLLNMTGGTFVFKGFPSGTGGGTATATYTHTFAATGAVTFNGPTLTLSDNQNNVTGFNNSNTTAGASSSTYVRATSSAKLTQILQYSGSTTAYGAFVANAGGVYTTSGNLVLMADVASSEIDFAAGGTTPAVSMIYDGTALKGTATGTRDLGTSSLLWRNLYVGGIHSTTFMDVAYRGITALRTLDATDYFVDCTANSFTVTLPTAVGITGREYIIKNSGTATTITIATTSSQTIDGSAPGTITTLVPLRVVSDGANWKTF